MDKQWETTSDSEEQTRSLGRSLGRLLRPGHLVLQEGPLGAGKTVFVQGIGQGMGLEERVTSPTFTLVHHYGYGEGDGEAMLVHADLYRLEGAGELDDLGLDGDEETAPVVVEWWRRAADGFPPGRLEIELQPEGEHRRRIRCRATDTLHGELLDAWRRAREGGDAAHADPRP